MPVPIIYTLLLHRGLILFVFCNVWVAPQPRLHQDSISEAKESVQSSEQAPGEHTYIPAPITPCNCTLRRDLVSFCLICFFFKCICNLFNGKLSLPLCLTYRWPLSMAILLSPRLHWPTLTSNADDKHWHTHTLVCQLSSMTKQTILSLLRSSSFITLY